MTKARILADYVAGGTTAAEFDYMDGVTSNVQTQLTAKAPLASPAFTGTPTGITAAHLEAGVLPSDVTGGSGLTALGTVTSGNLSNTAIVYPAGHVIQAVYATKDTGYLSTSTNYENTGSAVSITPKKSTSKIVVQFQADVWYSGTGDYFDLQIRATGGLTNANIMTSHDTGTHISGGYTASQSHQAMSPVVNTTSSITFTMWIKPSSTGRSFYYPNDASNGTGLNKVNILAWEVAQ